MLYGSREAGRRSSFSDLISLLSLGSILNVHIKNEGGSCVDSSVKATHIYNLAPLHNEWDMKYVLQATKSRGYTHLPQNRGLVIFYHFCGRIRNFGLVPFLRARKGSQHIDYSSTRRTSIQSGSGPLPLEMNAHARSFIHQSPPQFATPWAAATCHFLYKSKSRSDRKGNDCYLSTSFNVLSQTFFFRWQMRRSRNLDHWKWNSVMKPVIGSLDGVLNLCTKTLSLIQSDVGYQKTSGVVPFATEMYRTSAPRSSSGRAESKWTAQGPFSKMVGNRRKEGYFDDPAKYRLNLSSLTWLLSQFRIDLSSYIVFGGPITFLIFFRPEFMSIYQYIYIEIDPFSFFAFKRMFCESEIWCDQKTWEDLRSCCCAVLNKDFLIHAFCETEKF